MEFIDEKPVVAHVIRFRNRAAITETSARLVRDGDTVVWLVRARCQPPSYGPAAGDENDRCRLNVQVVEEAIPLDGAEREAALALLDHGNHQGYLDFGGRHDDPALFDATDFGPGAPAELHRLRGLLADELRDGESVVDAVQRLLNTTPPTETPPPPRPLPEHDGVEVVGSVPRSAETQRYLDEAFGR